MFKRVLFIAAVLFTIPNVQCSLVDLDRVIEKKKLSRQAPLPESAYPILVELIRDCEKITDTNQNFELATITLKYTYRTVEQLILKEKFTPQEAWCIKDTDRVILRLERQDGTPYLSFDAARIFHEIFYNPIFNLPQLKHITLSCMINYFRIFMEVGFLNYGIENIKDFACQNHKEKLLSTFKRDVKQKGLDTEKQETLEANYINSLMIQYQGIFHTHIENLFTFLFGTYSKKYSMLHLDSVFYKTSITFNGTPYTVTNDIAKCFLILNYELSLFTTIVEIDLLNVKAPLRDPEHRNRFKKEALNCGIIFKDSEKVPEEVKTLSMALANHANSSELIRYAYIQTATVTAKIESKVTELERELAKSKLREKQLEAELARQDLLSQEVNGQGKKKKNHTAQQPEPTGQVKKQINKLKAELDQKTKETNKLLKSVETLETDLSKTNERNKSLENNQREFMRMYNLMLERLTGMEKISKEMRENHDDLTKQMQQIPERSKALQCALDIAGESDLEALVTRHLELKAAIELLNERCATLKSANLLLGSAYREFQQENNVLSSNVESLSKSILEQGCELSDALEENIALTQENSTLKRDLSTLEVGRKFEVNIPKDSLQLFADNVQLDEENKSLKELNHALQTQVIGLNQMIQNLSHRTYQAEAYMEHLHKTNQLLQDSLKRAQEQLSKEKKKDLE